MSVWVVMMYYSDIYVKAKELNTAILSAIAESCQIQLASMSCLPNRAATTVVFLDTVAAA